MSFKTKGAIVACPNLVDSFIQRLNYLQEYKSEDEGAT